MTMLHFIQLSKFKKLHRDYRLIGPIESFALGKLMSKSEFLNNVKNIENMSLYLKEFLFEF